MATGKYRDRENDIRNENESGIECAALILVAILIIILITLML